MSIFGTIVTDDQVEDAVIALLRKWTPTYVSEVERQVGLDAGFYQRPFESSYTTRAEFDSFPEDQLPLVVVVSQGIDDDPEKDGGGRYRMVFQVGVTCVCSAIDADSTRKYSYRLGAAIRAALVQHQSLGKAIGGKVQGVNWIGTRNSELPSQDDRTLWATRQLFTIELFDGLTHRGGPVQPDPQPDPTDPYPDWPVVPDRDHVVITSSKETLEP